MSRAPKQAKPAVALAPAVTIEADGAGEGAGGESPVSATGAVGAAGQETAAPAVGEGAAPAPEPATPAASDAAGTDAAAEPQAQAGGVAAPAAVTILLLSNVDHDGERLAEGAEVTLPRDVAKRLVATGAARPASDD